MSRETDIIEKFEEELYKEGYSRKRVYPNKANVSDTYFDFLLDLKLNGENRLTCQEIFDKLKGEIVYYQYTCAKLNDDYLKLQNKIRHLEQDLEEMRRI